MELFDGWPDLPWQLVAGVVGALVVAVVIALAAATRTDGFADVDKMRQALWTKANPQARWTGGGKSADAVVIQAVAKFPPGDRNIKVKRRRLTGQHGAGLGIEAGDYLYEEKRTSDAKPGQTPKVRWEECRKEYLFLPWPSGVDATGVPWFRVKPGRATQLSLSGAFDEKYGVELDRGVDDGVRLTLQKLLTPQLQLALVDGPQVSFAANHLGVLFYDDPVGFLLESDSGDRDAWRQRLGGLVLALRIAHDLCAAIDPAFRIPESMHAELLGRVGLPVGPSGAVPPA